jgi:hypothetical protein
MNPELEKIFAQKRARRRWLAALPFPEKIRILVRLQAIPLLLFLPYPVDIDIYRIPVIG